MARDGVMQPGILPSGSLGWTVRPRPNLSTLGRYAIGVVALVLLTLRPFFDPARAAWVLLLDSTVVLGAFFALWLFYRNSAVFADREQVSKVDLLGRTKSLPLHDVRRAERYSVQNRGVRSKHLVFVGADGHKAFEVSGIAWDFGRLDTLCHEAGIQLSGSYDETVGVFGLNRRVPGTVGYMQVLIAFGVTVLIILLAVSMIGPTQR